MDIDAARRKLEVAETAFKKAVKDFNDADEELGNKIVLENCILFPDQNDKTKIFIVPTKNDEMPQFLASEFPRLIRFIKCQASRNGYAVS